MAIFTYLKTVLNHTSFSCVPLAQFNGNLNEIARFTIPCSELIVLGALLLCKFQSSFREEERRKHSE